jgi:hypothetical protein
VALSISNANSAAGQSCTIGAHNVGDDIYLYVYRDGSTTTASKPAAAGTVPAWVDIDNPAGANTNSSRTAHFVATATNHTTGTWTGATGMVAVVVSGQSSQPVGGHAEAGGATSNAAQAPAVTLQKTDGTSVLLEFYGHRAVTAWSAAPANYTRQTSVATEVCCNSKNSTTTDGAINQSNTASNSGYRGAAIEILAPSPLIETLTDTFASKDTTKWTWSAAATVTGNQAVLTPAGSAAQVDSNFAFDLNSSYYLLELASAGAASNNWVIVCTVGKASSTYYTGFLKDSSGNLHFREVVNNATDSTNITYSATDHRWLRIRVTSGTIYWDTSPDGVTWTNRRNKAVGMSYAHCYPQFYADGASGSMIVDNVNVTIGSISATLQKVTAELSGTADTTATGTVAATLVPVSASLTGAMQPSGTAAATLTPVTAAASGTQTQTGTIAAALQKSAASLTGAQTQTGTAAATLQTVGASFTGVMQPQGTASAVLRPVAAAATGAQTQTGTVAAALPPAAANLTGVMQPSGTVTATLVPAVASMTGAQSGGTTGAIAAALVPAAAALAGAQTQTGTIAATLVKAAAALTGVMQPAGTMTASLPPAQSSVVGAQTYTGTAAASLQKTAASLTGAMQPSGVIAATLGPIAAALTGTQIGSGLLAAILLPPTAALTAVQTQTGAIGAVLQKLTSSASGAQIDTGTLDAALLGADFAGSGQWIDVGVMAADLQSATALLTGEMYTQGVLAAILSPALAEMGGFGGIATGTLAATMSAVIFAGLGIRPAFPSADRTTVIAAADRVTVIDAADRITVVLAADRMTVVQAADRTTAIPAADRVTTIRTER